MTVADEDKAFELYPETSFTPKPGRPTAYRHAFAKEAKKLARLGATDVEVADFFEVDVRTIYRWKHTIDEFCQALNAGKRKADKRVIHSLYQRAVGYTFDSEKIQIQRDGEIIRAPIREHVPPDTTAAIFWLKNRDPDNWRDKTISEHVGKDGGPIETAAVKPRDLAKAMALIMARGLKDKATDGSGG
jgi:hypothetical protein